MNKTLRYGFIWGGEERIVLAQLEASFPRCEFSFYRTSGGAEIDITMSRGNKEIAIECKANLSPKLSRGNYYVIDQINPLAAIVTIPSGDYYQMKENIWVCGLQQTITRCREILN